MSYEMENLRKIGFDILINHFEPFLRRYIINEVLVKNFGTNWRDNIPKKIIDRLGNKRNIEILSMEIDEFFEELLFSDLKDIINRNYAYCEELLGGLVQELFIQLMNELNRIRIRAVHPKENFSVIDIDNIKRDIKSICRGKSGFEIIEFINNYKDPKDLDLIKIVDPGDQCFNNLPSADYDLDGGFVGRKKEIKEIKRRLYSQLDRIITIMGAGGVGKTALALEVAKRIVEDSKNQFKAIVWFSAKEERLTEFDIVKIEPSIKNLEQLINDILEVIDKIAFENYQEVDVPIEYCVRYLYKRFEEFGGDYLLIIDNLETIMENEPIVKFIEDAPCKMLITSRIGLGKLERPIVLKELIEDDSITLFRQVAEAKSIQDLIILDESKILELVNRMKRYPLVVKWSIGQFILGHDIEKAFPKKLPGDSIIAKFSFDKIFSLLSEDEKLILYAINIWDEPISSGMLKYLTDLEEDEFKVTIRKLINTSFIFQTELNTKYSILSLTSDFIALKLEQDEKIRIVLQNKKHILIELIEEGEKIENPVEDGNHQVKKRKQLIISLGIKTPEEKIAFKFVKTAKEFMSIHKDDNTAAKFYEKALNIAPNLGYSYGEYSKFEFFKRKNPEKAILLAKKSVELEPDNFHHWNYLGKILRIHGSIRKSIKALEKALELNPKYLRSMNQLARSYTYNKEFKKADDQLKISQERAKLQNKQFYVIALTFRVDNFIKWAKNNIHKNKLEDVIPQIKNAKKLIKEVRQVEPNNLFIYYYQRELFFTSGMLYEKKEEFIQAQSYYYSAIGKIFDNIEEKPYNDVIPRSYYRLSVVKEHLEIDNDKILKLINDGISNCTEGSEIHQKLLNIKEKLTKA